MDSQLSPRMVRKAQRTFYLFSFLNVISFQLMTGNIITLYALRLGAGAFLVGVLFSFVPMAQLLPFVGRFIVKRLGAVRTMGYFWFARYVLMLPLLFAPLFAGGENLGAGIILIIIGVVGFNLARGIGITAHNPIIGGITTPTDRGAFLARSQIIVHVGAILTGVATAVLLGASSRLFIYTILLGTGIGSGLLGALVVFRLPEPQEAEAQKRTSFFKALSEAARKKGFLRFLSVLAINSFVGSMITPFLVVFMKKAYGLADATVIYFTVAGSMGAITMAFISGFMIDRLGAKPLMAIFTAVLTFSLIPLSIAPQLTSPTSLWIFAMLIFFFITMGSSGSGNATNTYFFAFIEPEERLNLGIVYFLVTGISATVGSMSGGAILDAMQIAGGLPPREAFRIYFSVGIAAYLLILVLVLNLERIGAFSIRDVLNIFMSPRDLRALSLLNRLKSTSTVSEETNVIRALGETQSEIPVSELLQSLKSPRFVIRTEALNALSRMKPDENLRNALISEVIHQHFTTAYLAAEILGKQGVEEAKEALRQAMKSRDFFLCGKSMVALARIGDRESIAEIQAVLEKTANPRLIIHAAAALEIFQDIGSTRLLMSKMEKRLSDLVRDEIILALAGIWRMADWFYPLYTAFLENRSGGILRLKDTIAECIAKGKAPSVDEKLLIELADQVLQGDDLAAFRQALSASLKKTRIAIDGSDLSAVLEEAAESDDLMKHGRFRFLVAATVCRHAFSRR
jgi:hypothetical protein